MYETVEEARLRLQQTIVLYRGEPKYVRECHAGAGGDIMLQLDSLPRLNNGMIVSLSDPELNIRDFRQAVGYVNNVTINGGVTYNAQYVMRMPIRGDGYKQGLHSSNLVFPRGDGDRLRFATALQMPSFKDMLSGVYPSLDEVKNILESKRDTQKSVAFSRVFALARDHELGFYVLHYKGRRVASGDVDALILPSHNYYLAEILQGSGINVR